jgi:hypothetical protein
MRHHQQILDEILEPRGASTAAKSSLPFDRSPAMPRIPLQSKTQDRKSKIACWFIVAAALSATTLFAAEPGKAVSLFDGKTLAGWDGSADIFRIEDGAIVGGSLKAPVARNEFLVSEKEYGDFILELEIKADESLNSGVQIRSHCFDHATTYDRGNEQIKIPAGRVHGYQIEIDPSSRAYSGGLYDEGRRGWLQNLKDKVDVPSINPRDLSRHARELFQCFSG